MVHTFFDLIHSFAHNEVHNAVIVQINQNPHDINSHKLIMQKQLQVFENIFFQHPIKFANAQHLQNLCSRTYMNIKVRRLFSFFWLPQEKILHIILSIFAQQR